MDSVMKGLMGQSPARIFELEPPLCVRDDHVEECV